MVKKSLISHPVSIMRILLVLFALSAMFVFVAPQARASQKVDNSLYAELLAKHGRDGLVDYASFKKEHPKLKKYLEYMASINPDELSRDDAFGRRTKGQVSTVCCPKPHFKYRSPVAVIRRR